MPSLTRRPELHPAADFGQCILNALNIKRGYWRKWNEIAGNVGQSPFGSTPDTAAYASSAAAAGGSAQSGSAGTGSATNGSARISRISSDSPLSAGSNPTGHGSNLGFGGLDQNLVFGGIQGEGIAVTSNGNSPHAPVSSAPVPYPAGGVLGPDYKGYLSGDTTAQYAHFNKPQQPPTSVGQAHSGSTGAPSSNANGNGNTRSAHISPTMPHDTVSTDEERAAVPGGGLTKEMEAIFSQYSALEEGTNQVKSFGFGLMRDGPVPVQMASNGNPAINDGTARLKEFGYGIIDDPAIVTTRPAQTPQGSGAPRTTQTGVVPPMEAAAALPDGGTRWKWKWN